ncbi:hypothetical protein [Streptomyces pinistramenti]|uniref:hypothetical protein n=1 Tax=Streptomyces pinistramenti TaxID=2884812 RepID=UPI001D08AFE9|nr:hypothetical protein [Streptomyces pinistramenti]MCB5906107.1 hypothetical protein [Streptomyces pinistramenti]
MADFSLQIQEAQNDVNVLNQANTEMTKALEDMVQQLAPLLANTQGRTKDAWQEVQGKVDTQVSQLNSSHKQGVQALDSMINAMIEADNRGQSHF